MRYFVQQVGEMGPPPLVQAILSTVRTVQVPACGRSGPMTTSLFEVTEEQARAYISATCPAAWMRCWNHPTVTPSATRTASGFPLIAHGAINTASPGIPVALSQPTSEVSMSGSIGAASHYPPDHDHARRSANPGNDARFGHWQQASTLELGPLPSAVPCARLHAKHIFREWGLGN